MSEYYDHTTYPSTGEAGTSAALRAELDLIESGTGKLVTLAGNANKIVTVNSGATAQTASSATLSAAGVLAGASISLTTNTLSMTSLELKTAVSDETGSGALVFAISPTLVTPLLGTPTSGVLTNCTGTASGLTAGNTTTNANLTGHITSVGNAAVLGSFTSAQLATALTNETGSGVAVFNDTPTLIAPLLGTPTSGTLTNCTGYSVASISGAAAGVLTFLATPSSANLIAAVTDETGSGALVFGTAPTISAPNITGHPTVEGVTPTGATGTGNMVFSASPTFTGTTTTADVAMGNNKLTGVKTFNWNGVINNATTTGAVTIDWTLGNAQSQNEPTGTITYTFTSPANPCHLQLYIISDGTSTAQTITWPGTVIWLGVTWAAVANKKAVINFWYDGTNYYAQGANQV